MLKQMVVLYGFLWYYLICKIPYVTDNKEFWYLWVQIRKNLGSSAVRCESSSLSACT